MRTEVILLLGAEIDFANLYQRFGSKFYEALDKALGRLADFPEAGPVYHNAIRRILVGGFPVGVFYVSGFQRIMVLALLDLRRDPDRIRSEIAER
jgi:plasmid stabilization system protein ParE